MTALADGAQIEAVGLMSGTSADGVDAVWVTVTRSPRRLTLRSHIHLPFSQPLRAQILQVAQAGGNSSHNDTLDHQLAEVYGEAVARLCQVVDGDKPQLIGCHGQTVWHAPRQHPPVTIQLGSATVLARITHTPVVNDFRSADLAAGGEGAPLTPLLHHVLMSDPQVTRAVVNLGGIANLTHLPAGGDLTTVRAFDSGPANMVIDGLVSHLTGGDEWMDRDGRMAARGTVHESLLTYLLAHPYFARDFPKSTGREQFGERYLAQVVAQAEALSVAPDDLVATLTALTARTVADSLIRLGGAEELLLCGGGALNPTLCTMLAQALPDTRVGDVDEVGVAATALEAVAFAELACRYVWQEPGNLPQVTGAEQAVVLGRFTQPDA